ncbi:MAG TPA: hypothetical protein VJS43_11660, partial [Candidatus Acidoferrales bacterium]|nr:hypothetical protein [Candidatus Acidoferrales bacterium]
MEPGIGRDVKIVRAITGAVILVSSALSAQSTSPLPSFDVASIKLHQGGAHVIDISTSGARLTVQAETVLGLIVYAYDLKGN